MRGPAKTGAIIYAIDISLIAQFYEDVIGGERLLAAPDKIISRFDDLQLIVHKFPKEAESQVVISSSDLNRPSAIKLFFSVDNIDAARRAIEQFGGRVHDQVWQGPGFQVSNVTDPEGNVFHLRWSVPD
ncbi:hypothetical protein TDB9533_04110 [Thalassocella blandensis]|nr:hypothetical protein TDB9533_04110 [Thalassocella blandensis]